MSDAMTPLTEVLAVLNPLSDAGCRYWLEGGWGVDALVGRQTRPHRDLDVDIDAATDTAATTSRAPTSPSAISAAPMFPAHR